MTAASAGRALLDVYLAAIPEGARPEAPASPERRRALEQTKDPGRRRQRAWAWRLLELAAGHSLGLDVRELRFRCDGAGRWSCEGMEFSLSHTEGAVAVAVSDRPVGVDIEELAVFAARFGEDGERAKTLLRRIAAPEELADAAGRETETLLRLWTGKESLFKAGQKGVFSPKNLRCASETAQFTVPLPPALFLAVSGERIKALRLFTYRGGEIRPLDADKLRSHV